MDSIYVYQIKLPPQIKEMVTPCEDGYTVYIDRDLDRETQLKAYHHALEHIKNNDFASEEDIQAIEAKAHGKPIKKPVKAKSKRRSKWEAYHKKMVKKEKRLREVGYTMERYFDDDEYGCPTVKTRIVPLK